LIGVSAVPIDSLSDVFYSSAQRKEAMRAVRWALRVITVVGLISLVAGCGTAAAPQPTINVAYAGSLAYLMDHVLGPGFTGSAHIRYQGRGGGAYGLAQEIRAGTVPADVFVSVGTGPLRVLGRRVPWTVTFATVPLVLAYNPKSRFAPALQAIAAGRRPFRSLFLLLAAPGFRLGRTNPVTDPQGRAFFLMVRLAERVYGLPADTAARVLGGPENPRQVFSETGILTELQSGNLDAASAFLPEVLERGIPYVPLPPAVNFGVANDAPIYRQATAVIPGVGRVVGAPLTVAAAPLTGPGYRRAVRFLTYLLSPASQRIWRRYGYGWMPFVYTHAARVPAAIRHESP
jgi:molybdate/tungstate transport system substrate-binding protein